MAAKSPIAFAGLGSMGFGMAAHLLDSGFEVTGYDVYQPTLDRFAAKGGKVATSPKEAVQDSEYLICMVANASQATPLLFDPDRGAVMGLQTHASILMCSTVAPAYIEEVKTRLSGVRRPDIRLIDCPVSGGAGRAAAGTLSIFSSGEDDHLEHVREVLACLSGKLYRIPGGLGYGSKAKLIHQIFAGVNIAMVSEAMGLAARAGLSLPEVFEELKGSDANSWMLENRVPHILDPRLPSYSAMTIIAKDVGIITSQSRSLRFPLPILSVAEQLYLAAISRGWGGDDDCTLFRLYTSSENNLANLQNLAVERVDYECISPSDIGDLMVGVHAATMSEAMSFCDTLGIHSDLMHDIVANAAGASNVFLKMFEHMQGRKWSLRGIPDFEHMLARLSRAIEKAYQLRCPLFLSTAALQQFHREC